MRVMVRCHFRLRSVAPQMPFIPIASTHACVLGRKTSTIRPTDSPAVDATLKLIDPTGTRWSVMSTCAP
jgi:hypothetical protein